MRIMNTRKKGIVSFDIDMTLLNHADFKIPESATRALDLLRKDFYIVLSTGRDLDSKFSAGLREMINPDAVIHLNGTKITVGDEMIYEHLMDKGLVEKLLRFSVGKPFAMGLTTGTEDYYVNPEYVRRHDLKRFGESDRNFQDPWKLLDMDVRTLTYIGREPELGMLKEAFPDMKFPMFSSKEGADVIEKEASKAQGLLRLCEYYQIPVEDTVAFGDSMNDYEIVQQAGIGVAMGNSVPELKEIADYVTTPIGEDGVWNACVKLHLISA